MIESKFQTTMAKFHNKTKLWREKLGNYFLSMATQVVSVQLSFIVKFLIAVIWTLERKIVC